MSQYRFLDRINSPEDLRKLPRESMQDVSDEVREYLIDTVSAVGGHFSSSLGVVELTVALHYVLTTPRDRIIWDTGHQTYPHKILTGRRESLRSVRRLDGISGFPKRQESPYDTYNPGHAGTAITQMLGEAMARDALGETYKTVSIVGDASIATGMSFEALNHGGHVQTDCMVILNDNDMSISRNVGALNRYLNQMITSPLYNRWKKLLYSLLLWVPFIGPALQFFFHKVERTTKGFFTPGSLFSDFGFRYIGPVDGNNISTLIPVLEKALQMKGPILLHVLTQKGKGYEPAERNPTRFHSVSMFNREDGSFAENKKDQVGFSEIVGETLTEMTGKDSSVVAVTPAMIEGSGLGKLEREFPDRVYDVGIAEQHAVSFAGALATAGLKPYLCIYSTFMSRALSQFNQDIALIQAPVRIVIDRAGCVGPDGETHQGLFDMGMVLSIPGIKLFAPSSGADLKSFLLASGEENEGPIAVRFPKASADRSSLEPGNLPDLSSHRPELYGTGRDVAILAIGTMWKTGLELEEMLRKNNGISSMVVGIRWIRPLDFEYLDQILGKVSHFILIEDSYIYSSASSYILANLSSETKGKHLKTYAFPERFIEHGTRDEIFHRYGLSPASILDSVLHLLPHAIPGLKGKPANQ